MYLSRCLTQVVRQYTALEILDFFFLVGFIFYFVVCFFFFQFAETKIVNPKFNVSTLLLDSLSHLNRAVWRGRDKY